MAQFHFCDWSDAFRDHITNPTPSRNNVMIMDGRKRHPKGWDAAALAQSNRVTASCVLYLSIGVHAAKLSTTVAHDLQIIVLRYAIAPVYGGRCPPH